MGCFYYKFLLVVIILNVLQEVGSVGYSSYISNIILGVNGLTKIGDILFKLKYGVIAYLKKQEGNDGLESLIWRNQQITAYSGRLTDEVNSKYLV